MTQTIEDFLSDLEGGFEISYYHTHPEECPHAWGTTDSGFTVCVLCGMCYCHYIGEHIEFNCEGW